jgi:hypothetical protein
MKKYISIFSLLVLLIVGTLITSCDISNPIDDFVLTVDLPEESQVSLVFYDAATNELVTEPVMITIQGDGADKAMDVAYEPTTGMETSVGYTSFLVNSNYFPTEEEPIIYNLLIESDNYVSTSQVVTVDEDGSLSYDVYMIRLNNPPEGVAVQQNSDGSSNENGEVATDIVVEANASDNMQSQVTIPAGTILTSADGTPLSGQLTTTVAAYDGSSQGANNALPQDLDIEDTDEVLEVSSMLTFQVMDEHGNVADDPDANALGKKTATMDAKEVTVVVNVLKGEDLYSHFDDHGVIKLITLRSNPKVTITEITSNDIFTTYQITGKYRNIEILVFGKRFNRCSPYKSRQYIYKNEPGQYSPYTNKTYVLSPREVNNATITYEYNIGEKYFTAEAKKYRNYYTLYNLPRYNQVITNFKIFVGDQLAYSKDETNFCELNSKKYIVVNYTPPESDEKTYQDFKIIAKCGDDKQVGLPQASLTYSHGNDKSKPINFSNGEFTIYNVQSEVYTIEFSVTFKGKTKTGTLKFDLNGWSEDFEGQLNDLTSAVYDGNEYVGNSNYTYEVKNVDGVIQIILTLSESECDDLGLNNVG